MSSLSLLRVRDMRFQKLLPFSGRCYFKNIFVGCLYQKVYVKLSFETKFPHKDHCGARFLRLKIISGKYALRNCILGTCNFWNICSSILQFVWFKQFPEIFVVDELKVNQSFYLTSGFAVIKDKKRNEVQAIFQDFAVKLMEISRTGNASLLQVEQYFVQISCNYFVSQLNSGVRFIG